MCVCVSVSVCVCLCVCVHVCICIYACVTKSILSGIHIYRHQCTKSSRHQGRGRHCLGRSCATTLHVRPPRCSRSQCILVQWLRRRADPKHRKWQIHTAKWIPIRVSLVHPWAEVFLLARARPAVQFTPHHGTIGQVFSSRLSNPEPKGRDGLV